MASYFKHGIDGQVRYSSMSICASCLDQENAGRGFGSGVHRTKEVRIYKQKHSGVNGKWELNF